MKFKELIKLGFLCAGIVLASGCNPSADGTHACGIIPFGCCHECSSRSCCTGEKKQRTVAGEKKMALERTYAVIKPDAVRKGCIGKVIDRIEQEGFNIVAMKKMTMDKDLAERFYDVHREKPFFGVLIEAVTSGPIVAMVLEKDGAIAAWREVMGATNPAEAAEGTLRKLYGGQTIEQNVTHGSDATETAETEIKLIFPDLK